MVLVPGNLLRSQLGVDIHELKDLCTDVVKLGKLDSSKHIDVLVAPVLHWLVIHSLCLSKLILHGADNILCNLAQLN